MTTRLLTCGCPDSPKLWAYQYEQTGGRVWVALAEANIPNVATVYATSDSDVRRAVLGFAPAHDVRTADGHMLRQGACQGE
jgi:hypothetical protein